MVGTIDFNNVYTDISSLNAIKAAGREDAAVGMKKVAKQFESLFINMMLKTMRESNKSFGEGNYLSSNELEIHQQNFDNQLSLHLSNGKGIGLADNLYKQLMHQYDVKPTTENQNPLRADIKSPADYVRAVLPHAQKAAAELGVKPEFLVAQSALETGWGQRIISDSKGATSYNLFGIKADRSWKGSVASTSTLEYVDGIAQKEKATFRKYDSFAASFDDYAVFLKSNPRYQHAISQGADGAQFGQALQNAGYATDPRYAEKIQSIMESQSFRSALLSSNSEVEV